MIATDRQKIKEAYDKQGFYFPLSVMSPEEAKDYRRRLEGLEGEIGEKKLGNKTQLNYPHVVFPFAYEIACNPRILDAVEAIIGPDILAWSGTFFIKEPHTGSYVSWHQDLRYWGLADEEAMVSAWLALSPVTQANGCMRFVRGSHQGALVDHNDTFDEENFLTRGQEAAIEIDESASELVELRPGEISLHHGRLLHGSLPNRSDERRIGYVINYVAPKNRQVVGQQDFAMLVRGEDRYDHFITVPPPQTDLSDQALAWHRRILSAQNEALYDGADQGPS